MTREQAQPETIEQWWKLVYPYAVRLEKLITPAPETVTDEFLPIMRDNLEELHGLIHDAPYPEAASPLRENLLRASKQLYLCYGENPQTAEEAEFYYYQALTQLAQLHHQLVQHGFAS
jgi:hypothetical protein